MHVKNDYNALFLSLRLQVLKDKQSNYYYSSLLRSKTHTHMAHITNPHIYPKKVYAHNARIQKLIVDSIQNYNVSIIVTNYNINHDVCKNTITYGQVLYTSYTTKYTTLRPNDPYIHEFSKIIYNDVEKCMYTYPDYYINIFTKKDYNSVAETHMLREPDHELYLNMDYL